MGMFGISLALRTQTYPHRRTGRRDDAEVGHREEPGGEQQCHAHEHLIFWQLIPQKIGSKTVYIRGTTWMSTGWNWGSSITITSVLREGYTGVADEFVNDYKKVNLSH
jgi:hypothetical protein